MVRPVHQVEPFAESTLCFTEEKGALCLVPVFSHYLLLGSITPLIKIKSPYVLPVNFIAFIPDNSTVYLVPGLIPAQHLEFPIFISCYYALFYVAAAGNLNVIYYLYIEYASASHLA